MNNAQSKKQRPFKPKSAEKRYLFRAEVFQGITECTDGVNHNLQTINEAAVEDEAAARWIKSALLSFIS